MTYRMTKFIDDKASISIRIIIYYFKIVSNKTMLFLMRIIRILQIVIKRISIKLYNN